MNITKRTIQDNLPRRTVRATLIKMRSYNNRRMLRQLLPLKLPKYLRWSASSQNSMESFILGEKSEEVSPFKYLLFSLGSYGVVFKALRVDENDTDSNGKKR
jgi:hypothetical protein